MNMEHAGDRTEVKTKIRNHDTWKPYLFAFLTIG